MDRTVFATGLAPERVHAEDDGLVRWLIEAPRWLLVAALCFAPWAYGATRPWAIHVLSAILGAVVLMWMAECFVRRRRPDLPWPAVFASGLLFLQAAWMTFNAHSAFDAVSMLLLPTPALAPTLPGSVDGARSRDALMLLAGLFGTFLFCCELAQRPIWRKRLWATFVLVTASIAAFGIVQKIGGDAALAWFWEPGKRDPDSNFATFRYRGNAGAFLNLSLPLAAGLAFLAFRKHETPVRKTAWVVALFLIGVGAHLNPSRATGALALLLIIAFVLRAGWHVWRQRDDDLQPKLLAVQISIATLLLMALVGLSLLGRWETSWNRLGTLGLDPSQRSPTEIYLRMAPEAGLLGFGPGTFEAVFPRYQRTHDFGGRATPEFWTTHSWSHAHQDYLQAVIEWGWLGAALWAVLIFGGVARGAWCCGRATAGSSAHWLLLGCLLALGGVLLHSLIDFPLQIASIQLYCGVLLGICWGVKSPAAGRGSVVKD